MSSDSIFALLQVSPMSCATLGCSTTTAWTASPHGSLGIPKTVMIATSGCCARAFYTSTASTFSPPQTIMSLARSTMNRWPSSSSNPPSPVCIQALRTAAAVCAGFVPITQHDAAAARSHFAHCAARHLTALRVHDPHLRRQIGATDGSQDTGFVAAVIAGAQASHTRRHLSQAVAL